MNWQQGLDNARQDVMNLHPFESTDNARGALPGVGIATIKRSESTNFWNPILRTGFGGIEVQQRIRYRMPLGVLFFGLVERLFIPANDGCHLLKADKKFQAR